MFHEDISTDLHFPLWQLFIICFRPIELLVIAYVLIFNIDPLTQAPRL